MVHRIHGRRTSGLTGITTTIRSLEYSVSLDSDVDEYGSDMAARGLRRLEVVAPVAHGARSRAYGWGDSPLRRLSSLGESPKHRLYRRAKCEPDTNPQSRATSLMDNGELRSS